MKDEKSCEELFLMATKRDHEDRFIVEIPLNSLPFLGQLFLRHYGIMKKIVKLLSYGYFSMPQRAAGLSLNDIQIVGSIGRFSSNLIAVLTACIRCMR